jgi:hypothetical protein
MIICGSVCDAPENDSRSTIDHRSSNIDHECWWQRFATIGGVLHECEKRITQVNSEDGKGFFIHLQRTAQMSQLRSKAVCAPTAASYGGVPGMLCGGPHLPELLIHLNRAAQISQRRSKTVNDWCAVDKRHT